MSPSAAHRRTLVLGFLVPLLMLVVAQIVMMLTLPALPDPVAVHWGPTGAPDAFGSPTVSLVLLPLVGLGYLVLPLLVARRMRGAGPTINQRILLSVGPFFIGFLGTLIAGSLVMQRGLDDARDGPSILPVVAIAFSVGLAFGVLTWFLLPPSPAPEAAPDAATLPVRPLATDERVVWTRRVAPRSPVLGIALGAGAILVAGAAVLLAVVQPLALWLLVIPSVLIVVGYALTFWTLTVDRHGVLARGGFGSWPVIRIPLADIQSARVTDVDPLADFGGWGMRWAPRSTGLIVRSGEALEIARTNGRSLVATLDHAAVGAELVNALVLRARGGKPVD